MESEQLQIEVWENEGGMVEKFREPEDELLPRTALEPVIDIAPPTENH
jgi:hypothetical protein